MKQLLILSGKGGTGKTTIASAFIKLANAKIFADCDVDAPNLHLVINQQSEAIRSDYQGMPIAKINANTCISCGECKEKCRFDAIMYLNQTYSIKPYSCEGCGVCEAVCPVSAITMEPSIAGELFLYNDDVVFSTAQLKMGSGTSGKLVTEVKKQMRLTGRVASLAIIDASPGIGCPVIASLSGVDMVLIVAEPTISGMSDMERIIKTAEIFNVRIAVCINKYDIHLSNSKKIKDFCEKNKIPFAGEIPYDSSTVKAINNGQSIVDIDCEAGRAVKVVFENTNRILFEGAF